MISRTNQLFRITLIVVFAICVSCEKDNKSIINNENVKGSWFGSYDCIGLPGGTMDDLCTNIKITFEDEAQYRIEIEKPCCSNNFIPVNKGQYNIQSGKLYLTPENCLADDPSCSVSSALSEKSIRFYERGLQINSSGDWYFYEKYVD